MVVEETVSQVCNAKRVVALLTRIAAFTPWWRRNRTLEHPGNNPLCQALPVTASIYGLTDRPHA